MDTFIKFSFTLSLVFLWTGCFSKYETPDIAKKVDLEKAEVVADFNMSIAEEKVYSFYLYYVYDSKQYQRELDELKKEFPNQHLSKLPKTNTWKIISKIVGIKDSNEVLEQYGSKIVLKLTLTPLFDLKEDYTYFTQEHYHYTNYNKANRTAPLINKKIMKSDKSFEYIIDLSEYGYGVSTGGYTRTGYDHEKYWGYGKKMVDIILPKGDYHIKLENLEDVPEIKQIKTSFSIYHQYHK
ncbi:DUF5625 family protein [Aliarcobacter butzleri]|uniref:DUF5625 family protein n=1 Tax=Aliarcobacter butzleri TaxID=28197 RepID=UPI001EDDEFA9|nr:DUF5625 family protein [Aliarcobacter butzleri]MCG3681312.1 DUF5625 family protein [Aliarcobacter butzleri]